MTPLAQSIANEMCKPLAKRQIIDPDGIASGIDGFHFFDCTAISELLVGLGAKAPELSSSNFMFLPAEKVWIEFGPGCGYYEDNCRHAYLLVREKGKARLHIASMVPGHSPIISVPFAWIETNGSVGYRGNLDLPADFDVEGYVAGAVVALALINTPRIIGRRQHMPHAGLQRKLAAARGMVGKFPLRGWTEIVLEVTPPKTDGQLHETRLSGERCLHFCRQHLRVRNGAVEMVRDHWRGDPALGIKRSRYRLEPPQGRAA